GLIGFFNDLHKGRDTGKTWLWIIDISAILMTLISLTGLVLLLFLKKRRNAGLLLAIVGLIVVILFYWVF
ncbi:MAG: PepSY-associated TM helix domain-containing protein, partial [Sediminibacterium sp.]